MSLKTTFPLGSRTVMRGAYPFPNKYISDPSTVSGLFTSILAFVGESAPWPLTETSAVNELARPSAMTLSVT